MVPGRTSDGKRDGKAALSAPRHPGNYGNGPSREVEVSD
jgi:hypothetical protein